MYIGSAIEPNTGRFAVQDVDGGARVVWDSSFVPLDPATGDDLARMWEPFLPLVLGNLKNLVEKH